MAKKKKLEESKSTKKSSLFEKTLEMISEEHGDKIIKSLPQMLEEKIVGFSTGSLWLDWAICAKAGGMCFGHTLELYGPFSSGKTTIALGICANATANKKRVIYYDAENTLRAENVVNAGVDEDYFTRLRDRDGRRAAKVLEQLLKTGEVGVVVIDSIPAWKPLIDPKKGKDTEDVDYTKPKMAFSASFLSEALPYLNALCSEHDAILVILNQMRKNLSGYGSDQAFGGEVQKHVDSVRVKLSGKVRSKDPKERITDDEGNIVGQYTTAVCDKNKVSMPMREVTIPIFLGYGVNPYMELAVIASQCGVIENNGGRYYLKGSEKQLAYGMNNFVDVLFNDKDLYLDLRNKTIEALGINYSKDIKVVNAFHDEKGNHKNYKKPTPESIDTDDIDE